MLIEALLIEGKECKTLETNKVMNITIF